MPDLDDLVMAREGAIAAVLAARKGLGAPRFTQGPLLDLLGAIDRLEQADAAFAQGVLDDLAARTTVKDGKITVEDTEP